MWFWWMMYIISQNQRGARTRGWVFTGFLRHEKKKKKSNQIWMRILNPIKIQTTTLEQMASKTSSIQTVWSGHIHSPTK